MNRTWTATEVFVLGIFIVLLVELIHTW